MSEESDLPLFRNLRKAEVTEEAALSKNNKVSFQGHRKFGKYIVYVDESGDHGMQSIDDNYPIFVLAFCIFHKAHYGEKIVPALEAFKFRYFGHDQVILHEHEIRITSRFAIVC